MQQAFQKLALRLSGVDETPADFETLKKQDAIKLISDLQAQVSVLSEREKVALQDARAQKEQARAYKEQIQRLKQQVGIMSVKQQQTESEMTTLQSLKSQFLQSISADAAESHDGALSALKTMVSKLEDQLRTAESAQQETKAYYEQQFEQLKQFQKAKDEELIEKEKKIVVMNLELTEAKKTALDRAEDVARIELLLREKTHSLTIAETKQQEQLKELSSLTIQQMKTGGQIMDMEHRYQQTQREHEVEKIQLEEQLVILKTEVTSLERKLHSEKAARQADAETFQEEMVCLKAAGAESSQNANELMREKRELEEAAFQDRKKIQELTDGLSEANRKQFSMQQELDGTKAKLAQLQEEKNDAERNAQKSQERERQLRQAKQEITATFEQAAKERESLVLTLQERLQQLEASKKTTEKDQQQLSQQFQALEKDKATIEAQLGELRQQKQDLERELLRALKMQLFGLLEQQRDFDAIQNAQVRLQDAGEHGELAALRALMSEL